MEPDRENWVKRLFAKFVGKQEPPPSLAVEEGGFSYVRRREKTTVYWADVKEVFTFKRDILTVDLICVGLRVSDDGEYWEIDEELSGYEDVLAAMDEAFPGIRSDWWEELAFPPFEVNLITLWGSRWVSR